jgi:hypothetical protein
MAVDYRELSANLLRFYDFGGKVVLYVGAGGRQLLDPAIQARKLVAIDRDAKALDKLRTEAAERRARNSVEVIASSFEQVSLRGDVVYFEFCLHEMDDPMQALVHARALAPDSVVYDHSPGSEWSFYGAEEDKVRRSAEAMARFGIRCRESFYAEQRFGDHAELAAKLSSQGPLALERARRCAGATNIAIPMPYELVLL